MSQTTFGDQFRACCAVGYVGHGEGDEVTGEPAFPNEKFRAFVAEHGHFPTFRLNACNRYGGVCSSGNPDCRILRGIDA